MVPDATVIDSLSYHEAMELAYFGAKVLHPRALIPIAGTRAELHVRSFIKPDMPGTEVSATVSLGMLPSGGFGIVADLDVAVPTVEEEALRELAQSTVHRREELR